MNYPVLLSHMRRQQTVKTSFSIEPALLEEAKAVARVTGYKFSFSGYVSDLLRKDIDRWRLELKKPQSHSTTHLNNAPRNAQKNLAFDTRLAPMSPR